MVGAGLAVLLAFTVRPGAALPSRQSFEIAAGPAGGSYFAVGEVIARTVSHPAGLARCDRSGACGPPGLIVSTRSSEGPVADVLAVEAGEVASALAPGNVVADAVAGRGAFRKAGKQSHVRVIAALFPEAVQLAVSTRAKIAGVRGLRGRRVSLGSAGSGSEEAAKAILAAYGVPWRSLKVRHDSAEAGAALLRQGKLDAFFFLGPVPSPVVAELLTRGEARLAAVGGKVLPRLPGLAAVTVPAGATGNAAAVPTVGCRVLWIVRDSAPPATVYGLLRALYHPANRGEFATLPADRIGLEEAAQELAAPLHPGAERFYREAGVLGGKERRGK